MYITANVSGGHLNPAVTLSTMITGHINVPKGLAYIFVQICGACVGMLMVVCLLPLVPDPLSSSYDSLVAVSASPRKSSDKSAAAVTMQAGLVPNSYVGMGNDGTGCFQKGTGVSLGMPGSFLKLLSAICLQDS